MNFQRVTRLWCSMSSLWTAWRLVCKSAEPLKLITRHFIGDRLQCAGVERAGHAITAIGAAIKEGLEMHPGYGAVFLDSRLHVHQHWMPAAVTIENFLARQRYLHRASCNHRKLADHHFVIERIALAAKTAAVWSGDDANVTGGQLQNFCQGTMNVV